VFAVIIDKEIDTEEEPEQKQEGERKRGRHE